MNVNRVIQVGNCAEPEIISTDNGKIAKFGFAMNESYKNKQGERIEKTEWSNVVVYGNLAEIVEKYVVKGMQLYIEGKMCTRQWDDKDGNKRYTTEIVADNMQMLGNKQSNEESASASENVSTESIENIPTEEDDLPF